jgi:hypothetical protein
MSVKLPSTLARYFDAANAHDADGVLEVFSARAIVKDEGREHRGALAIRKWIMRTIEKYDFKVEPTGVATRDRETVVTGLVSGNFPGSPVSLRHAFTLDSDQIVHLEIG